MNIQWPVDDWKNLTPRRWQVDALKVLMQHYSVEKPTNAIVRAITGAGKSKAMAQFLACCQLKSNETIVVSTPSIYLVEQLEETFRDRLESKGGFMEPRRVGTFYTHGKDIMEPIILACSDSIPELARRLQNIGKRCALWMADECVTGDTMIETPTGRVSMDFLKPGDEVIGFHHPSGEAVPTRVKHCFKNNFCGKLFYIGNSLKVTPNHPIFSDGYYTEANQLKEVNGIECFGGGSRDTKLFSKTSSWLVKQDNEIVYLPVYNIETETGNYFAEGILVHNCHKTEVKTLKDAYATLLPNTVLGFTGTPWRANEKESLSLFEKMIVDYGPAKAIADKNVVVPWRIIRWEDKRELCLDETCYEMTKNAVGPGMFNALTIADAVKFAGYLKLKGFPAEAVHSKMPKEDVKKILSNLQRGILRAVVHVNKLAEGADFPWLCWLCMRRPVTSRVRFPQEIGRVLRFDDGIASGTGRVKTEAILYDPHGLFDVMKLTYEEVLGGDFIIDEPDVEEDEGRRLNRQLEGRGFDLMRHLTEVKAGKQPLQTEPLAAYLTELVNAFDLCGLIDRKIASRSWRNEAVTGQQEKTVVNMRWVPNARKCVPSIHKTALQILTGANETVDGERKKFAAKMNRGVASDLLSVLMSLADKKKWPNFSQLDKSASEQLEKHKAVK